jgi:hypothetical protein
MKLDQPIIMKILIGIRKIKFLTMKRKFSKINLIKINRNLSMKIYKIALKIKKYQKRQKMLQEIIIMNVNIMPRTSQ